MELYPTPESWRTALLTAIGSFLVAVGAAFALVAGARAPWFWVAVALAAVATFVPAVGTLTSSVDVDDTGVTVRRFGRHHGYPWSTIAEIDVHERRAAVPDGTEYHWVLPARGKHVVAVPRLVFADGTTRELPALSSAASAGDADYAHECVTALQQVRTSASSARQVPAA